MLAWWNSSASFFAIFILCLGMFSFWSRNIKEVAKYKLIKNARPIFVFFCITIRWKLEGACQRLMRKKIRKPSWKSNKNRDNFLNTIKQCKIWKRSFRAKQVFTWCFIKNMKFQLRSKSARMLMMVLILPNFCNLEKKK